MNDGRGHRRRPRMWRPGPGLLAIVVGIVLLAAACSGSSSPGGSGAPSGGSARPSGGSSARPSAGDSPSSSSAGKSQLAYSECMNSHGVPGVPTSFPSPVPGKPPSKLIAKPADTSGPAYGSPEWQAAQQACQSLLPASTWVAG
jgi:hypothetical protein